MIQTDSSSHSQSLFLALDRNLFLLNLSFLLSIAASLLFRLRWNEFMLVRHRLQVELRSLGGIFIRHLGAGFSGLVLFLSVEEMGRINADLCSRFKHLFIFISNRYSMVHNREV